MIRVCKVEGCFTTTKTKGERLYCFPYNPERCVKWIEFSGSSDLMKSWEKRKVAPTSWKICSRHFCEDDFENYAKVKLKGSAIPSRNGPFEINIEVKPDIPISLSPSTSPSSNVHPTHDSSYAVEVGDGNLLHYNNRRESSDTSIGGINDISPANKRLRCSVDGCFISSKTEGMRLFPFPKHKEICSKWIEFSCSLELIEYWDTYGRVPSSFRICSLHFCDADFEDESKVELKSTAIPSQNGPFEMELEENLGIGSALCDSPIPSTSSNCSSPVNPIYDASGAIEVSEIRSADNNDPSLSNNTLKFPDGVIKSEKMMDLDNDGMEFDCGMFSSTKRVCLVEGCFSTTFTKGVKLFCFPSCKETCTKWVQFTGSVELLEYWEKRLSLGKPMGTHCKICSHHFCDEDFENRAMFKLARGIVPSRNGPPEIEN